MADHPTTPAEAEDKLWQALKDTRTGMLGLTSVGAQRHLQPMTGFEEPEAKRLWFFTRDDTDLARDLASGAREAVYTVVTKDAKVYASIAGEIAIRHDRERIDEYWNPVVAAWYPEGKDDPHLTLLCFELTDARVWLSDKGALMFMIEVAKANMTRRTPDLGERQNVSFLQ